MQTSPQSPLNIPVAMIINLNNRYTVSLQWNKGIMYSCGICSPSSPPRSLQKVAFAFPVVQQSLHRITCRARAVSLLSSKPKAELSNRLSQSGTRGWCERGRMVCIGNVLYSSDSSASLSPLSSTSALLRYFFSEISKRIFLRAAFCSEWQFIT